MAEGASGDLTLDTLVLAGARHARAARAGFVFVVSGHPEYLRVLYCAITVGLNSTGSEVGDIADEMHDAIAEAPRSTGVQK